MNTPIPPGSGRGRKYLARLKTGVRKAAPFSAGVLSVLLALYLYGVFFPSPKPLSSQEVRDAVNQVLASATPPPAYSDIVYQLIRPSLVLVEAQNAASPGDDSSSLGSGVIVDQNGDILTSLHVVAKSISIRVVFADGTQSEAKIANSQPDNDIAVLTPLTPPQQIVPAVLGNPNAMSVGDDAYVVGNPFGLYASMSAGVISGFNRSFQQPGSEHVMTGLIQIDAAVNPGNSGGPLLNRAGQVIGIVEGIVNPTKQDVFIGIGFAVPITTAGGAAGLPPD